MSVFPQCWCPQWLNKARALGSTQCVPLQISDDYPNLSDQGYYRADNLNRVFGWGNTPPGAFNTPDVIYAQKKGKVGPAWSCQCPMCAGQDPLHARKQSCVDTHMDGVSPMQKDSSSIRPYETVKPLAEKLLEWDKHHDLEMGERTVSHGRVFDNRFRRKKHKVGSCSCSDLSTRCRTTHTPLLLQTQ